jgi:hypothetical protein
MSYVNSPNVGLELPLKALELARIRVKKILRDNSETAAVVNAMTTYGAIAAINSLIPNATGSNASCGTYQSLINITTPNANSYTATPVATIYGTNAGIINLNNAIAPSSAATWQSAGLKTIYTNFPNTFAALTSLQMMIALTNNSDYNTSSPKPQSCNSGNTVAADNVVYSMKGSHTYSGGNIGTANEGITGLNIQAHPFEIILTSYSNTAWTDANAPALQSYINYLAAIAVYNATHAGTVTTLDNVLNTSGGNGTKTFDALMCLYTGAATLGNTCSTILTTTTQWSTQVGNWLGTSSNISGYATIWLRANNLTAPNTASAFSTLATNIATWAQNYLHSLPYLYSSIADFTGTSAGKHDADALNNLLAGDYLGGNSNLTGLNYIISTGFTENQLLSRYCGLLFTRAATAYEYGQLHKSLGSINTNYTTYGPLILQNPFILSLINQGIMSFDDAYNDLSTGNQYSIAPAFKLWGSKLPVSVTQNQNTSLYYPDTTNFDINADFGKVSAWHTIMTAPASNDATPLEPFWFSTFATQTKWGSLLAEGNVNFQQLLSIPTTTAGHGIYGDGSATSDTEANFLSYFGKGLYTLTLVQAGIPINAFCADITGKSCAVNINALYVSHNSGPTYATEFNDTFACATGREVSELLGSTAAQYWQSPYLLLQDVMTAVCS